MKTDELSKLLEQFKNGGLPKSGWFELRRLAHEQGYCDTELTKKARLVKI